MIQNQNGAIHLLLAVILSVVIGTTAKLINDRADLIHKELLQHHKYNRIQSDINDYLVNQMNEFVNIKLVDPSKLRLEQGCSSAPETKEIAYNGKTFQRKCSFLGKGRLERFELEVSLDEQSQKAMAYMRPMIASVDSDGKGASLEGQELKSGDIIFDQESVVLTSSNSLLSISTNSNQKISFEGTGRYVLSKEGTQFVIEFSSGQFKTLIKEGQGAVTARVGNFQFLLPLGEMSFYSVEKEETRGIIALVRNGTLLHLDSGRFLGGDDLWAIAVIDNGSDFFYQIKSYLGYETYNDSLNNNKTKLFNLFNELTVDETWQNF